ncbi:glucosamine-6-phosphate deaminase [Salmonella enterica subsp. enterica serovar Muenchen]|nr:glucosamine-6-phosphate deaminase [Salmonella enterica]EDK3864747.1 glucosamine-6-phosphate deaminase [Salmonella enterica subsp. enterica serovar Muenchen]
MLIDQRITGVAPQNDAPRDKCAPFREINGIAAAFQYSQKNYNPTASSFL